MEYTEEKMLERYKVLVAKRNENYAAKEALERKLEILNLEAQEKLAEARVIAKEIDEKYLNQAHFALKKEIALLARNLGRPGGPLAHKW